MNAFPLYLKTLVFLEGDESDSPIDSGGHTVKGLTKATRDALGLGDDPSDDQVSDAYHRNYWQLYGCHLMPPVVAWLVCDVFVNHSPATAAKVTQRALGNVKVDGKFGPKSIRACEDVKNLKAFLTQYAFHRRGHYARRTGVLTKRYILGNDDKKFQLAVTQEHGWQNRVDRLVLGIWEAGLLKKSPTIVTEVASTATVAAAVGTVAAITTGSPVVTDTTNVVQSVIEMAVSGDLNTVSAATAVAGYAYNRWVKNSDLIPRWAKRLVRKRR